MKSFWVGAGVTALGCAAPVGAQAQVCSPGHFYRPAMDVCVARFFDEDPYRPRRGPTRVLRSRSAPPEVGDIILFGSRAPTLLNPPAPIPPRWLDEHIKAVDLSPGASEARRAG